MTQTSEKKSVKSHLLGAAVIVAALGYFVDIYDLLLFNMVRVESLRSIGYAGRELEVGAILHNIQMTGLMLGGIGWGILADKKGRLSVLFGSIFLYSIGNFLNAYATNFTQYAFCRFFAGLGLAGELGAGITLVAEILPTALRGYGTMIVATVGVSGAIVGGIVAQVYDWRTAYQIGGVLGFLLLLLRIGVVESGVFTQTLEQKTVSRGNFFSLFSNRDRFKRFSLCILAGVPIWYAIGILVAYSPEFGLELDIREPITSAKAVMYCYLGFVIGDFSSGLMSQLLKSRKKALYLYICFTFSAALIYLFMLRGASSSWFYAACVLVGTGGGYWAVIVTVAAELFGTNLRATVATAVPNFIRFSVVPMSLSFIALKNSMGVVNSGLVIGAAATLVALFATRGLPETFHQDLEFLEHD
jgi:putative MFS transporter